jgi:hypothetical protein
MKLSNHHHKVFVHVDGKKFEVTAIVNSMKDANDICAADKTVGVIDETSNGMIIIAKLLACRLTCGKLLLN